MSSDASGDIAIEAHELRKRYGDVAALRGVDLRVETGTIFGLLGPNGAGKTTAVRILTTLLVPDGGSARVAGLDVVRDAARLRAHIGLAGQYAAVDENLTGFENLEMVGRLYHLGRRVSRARARELLGGVRSRRRRRPARAHLLGRHAPPPRPRRGARRTAAGALPRRADDGARHPQPDRRSGRRSRRSSPRARPCSSPPSTSTRPTASPTGSPSIDQGLVIAEGTPDELKAQVGGDRLEVRLEDRGAERRGDRCARPDRRRAPVARGRLAAGAARAGGAERSPRRSGGSTRPGSASTTSRCADRRSTTSSSTLTGHAAEEDGEEIEAAREDGGGAGELGGLRRLRHARAGQAQPPAHPAPARPAGRLHRAAGDVRAALRLRLRRRDRDARASTTSTS